MQKVNLKATFYSLLILTILLLSSCQRAVHSDTSLVSFGVLPDNWKVETIGTTTGAGNYDTSGIYTIVGSGTGLATTADNFTFVRKRVSLTNNAATFNDGYMIARLMNPDTTTTTNPSPNFPVGAVAGVMMRGALTAGAQFALVGVKKTAASTYQIIFQTRTTTGGTASTPVAVSTTVPRMVKLERQNNVFTAYYTTDDLNWTPIGTATTIAMPTTSKIFLGYAVASGNTTQAKMEITGTFDRRIFYVNPTGADTNSGETFATPLKTFATAIPILNAGDVLVLQDGTYTKADSGLLKIKCSAVGGTAKNGSAANTSLPITQLKVFDTPITVRAQNERKAILDTIGAVEADKPYAFLIQGCSYWVIEGIAARNRDIAGSGAPGGATPDANIYGHIFYVKGINDANNQFNLTDHIILRRVLAYLPNYYGNNHAIVTDYSNNVLIIESEVYGFHRHGIDAFTASDVTIVRSYANSLDRADRNLLSGAKVQDGMSVDTNLNPGGDDCITLYGSSNSKIINSICENRSAGFTLHATDGVNSTGGGQNNAVLGSISLNNVYGFAIDSRRDTGTVRKPTNTLIENLLVINPWKNALVLKSTPYVTSNPASNQTVRFQNLTVYGSAFPGATAPNEANNGLLLRLNTAYTPAITCADLTPETCGFYMNKALVWNNGVAIENGAVATPFFPNFRLENSTFIGNSSQPPAGTSGNFVNILLATGAPSGFTGTFTFGGQTYPKLVWSTSAAPANDPGASIRKRYNLDGTLSTTNLWNANGTFPCGTQVIASGVFAGIYNMGKCQDVNTRLGVTVP